MNQANLLADENRLCVAIVDDHDAIRMGLQANCAQKNIEVCASVASVRILLETNDLSCCDLVILDLSLADGSLVEDNVRQIVATGTPVVIYSIADKQALIRAALRAGAAAIVPKSQSIDELFQTIQHVADGVVVNNLQTTAAIDADDEFKVANLSPREREVLSLYASGLALKQVATALDIKLSTAKEHIDRVRSKYSGVGRVASTKTDLLLRAMEDGIIDEGLL
jgi:DNA-binding NarL/FixJ family response regulator